MTILPIETRTVPFHVLCATLYVVLWISLTSLVGVESCDAQTFRKLTLTAEFWSEGVAIADINQDGNQDIVSGPFWYEGPDFKRRHEFRSAADVQFLTVDIDPKDGRPPEQLRYSDSFITFVYDFNGDGWPDILSIGLPGKEASWYENPGTGGLVVDRSWKRHLVFKAVGNESPAFGDLVGGKPVLVFLTGGRLGYAAPDWKNSTAEWNFHPISAEGDIPEGAYIHGLGFGDVNNDGRNDVLVAGGWWEQPSSLAGDPAWKFHRFQFAGSAEAPSRGGAQMYVYDVNGDGLPDVISSLDAHGYGLAWYEQLKNRDAGGEIQFVRHIIMNGEPTEDPHGTRFSQLHALALVDLDGDGLKDIVTGKRFWAHGRYRDAEPDAPPVLYWFRLIRGSDGQAVFEPHLIDSDSGVGTQVTAGDVNSDGLADIVVANKRGTFVFLQRRN